MFRNICGKNVLFHIFFTYYYHFLMKFTNVCVSVYVFAVQLAMLTVKVDPIFVFFPPYTCHGISSSSVTRACTGLCAIHRCNRPYVIYMHWTRTRSFISVHCFSLSNKSPNMLIKNGTIFLWISRTLSTRRRGRGK